MIAITYTLAPSDINLNSDAFTIRMAYLLAEEVCLTGNSFFAIAYNRMAKEHKQINVETTLKSLASETPPDDVEMHQSITGMLAAYNLLKKKKNKSSKDFFTIKMIEHKVHNIGKLHLDDIGERLQSTGLTKLEELLDEDNVFIYKTFENEPETVFDQFDKASKIFNLDFNYKTPENRNKVVFFLNSEFFNSNTFRAQQWHMSDTPKAEKTNAFMQSVFQVPNLNLLSGQELITLKKQLQTELQVSRDSLLPWINAVHTNNADATELVDNAAARAFQQVKEAVTTNGVMKLLYSSMHSTMSADMIYGSVPLYVIWDFYRELKAIPDATWEVLQQWRAEKKYDLMQCPFICPRIINHAQTGNPPAGEAQHTKKNLDL